MLNIDLDPTLGNQDTVQFGAGIDPDEIMVSVVAASNNATADSVLGIPGGQGVAAGGIRIAEALAASGPGAGRMERIEFADGTVWSEAELRARAFTGTAGNDRIQGWSDDDVIDGGAGNDTLNGGNGADTYVLRQGGGQDRVEGWQPGDRLRLEALSDETRFARRGYDLVAGFRAV